MTTQGPQGTHPVVITCEHATGALPNAYKELFVEGSEALGGPVDEVLQSHRGFDAGALALAQHLGAALQREPLVGEASRLVIDLNRSLRHPALYSRVTRALPKQARQQLVQRYWQPHRQRVQQAVAQHVDTCGRGIHLAMHSFTPVWRGVTRAVDVGLLYDPRRSHERALARCLRQSLTQHMPNALIRFNQPYQGKSDGLPTALRRLWLPEQYQGVEIEVNQKWVHNANTWPRTLETIVAAIVRGLDIFCC